MQRNIAIIPARSGSKGLPDKNIKQLDGKPLIAYSIEAALKSKMFEEVMVSTDSNRYAEIATHFGANVPFLRSEKNASDYASSWDAVLEVLAAYKTIGIDFDTVCLLQPTSPLRTSEDIIAAYNLYNQNKATSVIGVCESEHSPLWMNRLPSDLSMDNFIIPSVNNKPRQVLDKFYRINGAIYIVNTNHLQKSTNIYINSFAYIMKREKSIDIDSELDFICSETIMQYLKSKAII